MLKVKVIFDELLVEMQIFPPFQPLFLSVLGVLLGLLVILGNSVM